MSKLDDAVAGIIADAAKAQEQAATEAAAAKAVKDEATAARTKALKAITTFIEVANSVLSRIQKSLQPAVAAKLGTSERGHVIRTQGYAALLTLTYQHPSGTTAFIMFATTAPREENSDMVLAMAGADINTLENARQRTFSAGDQIKNPNLAAALKDVIGEMLEELRPHA